MSLVADWLVQMSYFFYKTGVDPRAFAGRKTLFEYQTGVIGDLVILPLVNVLIFFILWKIKFRFDKKTFFIIIPIGLAGDFFIHYMQGVLKLVNWTMPVPFQWNFGSYWHMFSFFFQWSYIVLFFLIFFKKKQNIFKDLWLKDASAFIFLLLLIFVGLFLYDYHFLFGF